MKKLILLFLFNSFTYAQLDWSDPNECKLTDHTEFTKAILEKMTLEQKVGQVIMPEINSVSPEQAKKFHLGTILNGGGGFPNQKKNSTIEDWKNLSKNYYDASTIVDGQKSVSYTHLTLPTTSPV